MAKIENLTILNPADKTHLYAVAIGKGAPDFVFFLTEKDWYVTITILSRGRVTM